MSCIEGADCREALYRRNAFIVLGLMAVIFVVLSIWSFIPSRVQAIPASIEYGQSDAVLGKRVFQAYNCMGCHTIVGNGAYFGPDLTRVYAEAGPAWLAAFLPSANGWPTATAVQVQLQKPLIQSEAGTADIAEYRQKFPGAEQRIALRGGHRSLMPNLPLDAAEIEALIAFFKYTSAMHTEGWPPAPHPDRSIPAWAMSPQRPAAAGGTVLKVAATVEASATGGAAAAASAPAGRAGAASQPDEKQLIAQGKQLVADLGCVACHAADTKRTVGPGWGGMLGSEVELADGSRVTIDRAYLEESIRDPDAKVVAGYPPHVMPAYGALVPESDMNAIIAYLGSL